MATHAVTDASFTEDVLQADTPVLLDFWAEWCGPCKKMGLTLEDVSEEFEGRLKIAKMDIQENPDTPGKFHVRGNSNADDFQRRPSRCHESWRNEQDKANRMAD